MVNKLLNEKINGCWLQAKNQLENIRNENSKRLKTISEKMEKMMMQELAEIKATCETHIDTYKKKNNSYWLKVKETLNKLNSRIVSSEESVGAVGKQISKL